MLSKSIKKTLQSLDQKHISIRELSQEYIKKIKEKSNLNIFIHFEEQKILDLVNVLKKYDLKLENLDGMKFNILNDEWRLSSDKSINYIGKFIKY